MPKIRINKIHCNVPEEIDKDEMFLKYDGHKFWPTDGKYFRIDVNEKVEINQDLDVPEGWNEIELWDYDFVTLNDHLGTFKIKVDDSPGKYSASMILNTKETKSASYFLEWEVL